MVRLYKRNDGCCVCDPFETFLQGSGRTEHCAWVESQARSLFYVQPEISFDLIRPRVDVTAGRTVMGVIHKSHSMMLRVDGLAICEMILRGHRAV